MEPSQPGERHKIHLCEKIETNYVLSFIVVANMRPEI